MKFSYPTVIVHWDDAFSDASWQDLPKKPLAHNIAVTVGFLIRDEPNYILVADSYFTNDVGYISGTTQIPRGMIVDLIEVNINEKNKKRPPKPQATEAAQES